MRRSPQDDYKKLLPLKRIAQASSYSLGYVSILVQRKKLKAKKIGNKYYSTREWFDEYLELHARDEKRLAPTAGKTDEPRLSAAASAASRFDPTLSRAADDLKKQIDDLVRRVTASQAPAAAEPAIPQAEVSAEPVPAAEPVLSRAEPEEKNKADNLAEALKEKIEPARARLIADVVEPEIRKTHGWKNNLRDWEKEFKADYKKAKKEIWRAPIRAPKFIFRLAAASLIALLSFYFFSWPGVLENLRHRNAVLARRAAALENLLGWSRDGELNPALAVLESRFLAAKNFLDLLPERARGWGKTNLAFLNDLLYSPSPAGRELTRSGQGGETETSLIHDQGRVAGATESAGQASWSRLLALANVTARRGGEVLDQAKYQAGGVLKNSAERQRGLSLAMGEKLALLTKSAASGVALVSANGQAKLNELAQTIKTTNDNLQEESAAGRTFLAAQSGLSLWSMTDLYGKIIDFLLPDSLKNKYAKLYQLPPTVVEKQTVIVREGAAGGANAPAQPRAAQPAVPTVTGNAAAGAQVNTSGTAISRDHLTVDGTAQFNGDVTVNAALTAKTLTVTDSASFLGPLSAAALTADTITSRGDLTVVGNSFVGGNELISGNLKVAGTFQAGHTEFSSLGVTGSLGASNLSAGDGGLTVSGDTYLNGDQTVIAGAITLNSLLDINHANSTALTVGDGSSDTFTVDTQSDLITINGAVALSGNTTISGGFGLSGALNLDTASTAALTVGDGTKDNFQIDTVNSLLTLGYASTTDQININAKQVALSASGTVAALLMNFSGSGDMVRVVDDGVARFTLSDNGNLTQTASTTGSAFVLDQAGGGSIFDLRDQGVTRLAIADLGVTSLTASSTAGTALTVTQNDAGDILNLYDGANEILTVLDGGNVGIGTTSPASLLHLTGLTEQLRLGYDGQNYASFTVGNNGALTASTTNQATTTITNAFSAASSLYVLNNGNVGIGTTSPDVALEVAGNAYFGSGAGENGESGYARIFGFDEGASYYGDVKAYYSEDLKKSFGLLSSSDSQIRLDSSAGDKNILLLPGGGLVGVGTTSPYARLTVWGQGNAAGDRILDVTDSASTSLLAVLGNGNVGIGTANPEGIWHVDFADDTGTKIPLIDRTNGAGGQAMEDAVMRFRLATAGTPAAGFGPSFIFSAQNQAKDAYKDLGQVGAIYSDVTAGLEQGAITFQTVGYAGAFPTYSEKMRIMNSGNVGVGTTSPSARLSVKAGGTDTGRALAVSDSSNAEKLTLLDNGYLGLGTTSPAQVLSVAGQGYFTGNLIADGASGLIVNGASAGLTFYGTGNHDITAAGGTLRIGANTIIGNILAMDDTVDIGDAATRFDKIYANEVNATTLVGSIVGGNVLAETLTINQDNVSNDLESSYLAFERGGVTPNAVLAWDSAHKIFDLNQPVYVQNDSLTNATSSLLVQGWSGQTGDLFRVASSTGYSDTYFNITATGRVGVGTTTPAVALDIYATDGLRLPVGTTAQRPGQLGTGMIRYNTETSQFEGYGVSSWGSLGGVIDVDQDTKITAENSAGADNDQLKFFTAGVERARFDTAGNFGISTTSPYSILSISNSVSTAADTPLLTIASTTAGTATSTLLTVLASGNVGIGTTSPGAKLEVASGQIFAPNGSVSAPSYSFSNSPNTGFFYTSSNNINLAQGGDQKILWTGNNFRMKSDELLGWIPASDFGSSLDTAISRGAANKIYFGNAAGDYSGTIIAGNVGIGNTSPGALLHVNGSDLNGTILKLGTTRNINDDNATIDVEFLVNTTQIGAKMGLVNEGSWDTGMAFYTRTSEGEGIKERLRINNAGNVGIGTTSPWGLLSINANGITAGAPQFVVGSSTRTDLVITQSGNVGIGTTSPWAKLSVNGTSAFTSTMYSAFSGSTAVPNIANTGGFRITVDGAEAFDLNNARIRTNGLYLNVASEAVKLTEASGNATLSAAGNILLSPTGNVGIGTTSPYAALSVAGRGVFDKDIRFDYFTATSTTATSTLSGGLAAETNGLVYDWQTNNVGIGTASPGARLEVAGDTSTRVKISGTVAPQLYFYPADSSKAWTVQDTTSGQLQFQDGTGENRVVFNKLGLVGIGTTSPWGLLSVNASANGLTAGAPQFVVGSSTRTDFIVTQAGYVGIGTASPSSTLYVNGTTTIANGLYINKGAIGYGTPASLKMQYDQDGNFYELGTGGNSYADFFIKQNTTAQLVVKSGTGNIGIGTTTPEDKLDIAGGGMRIEAGNAIRLFNTTNSAASSLSSDSASALNFTNGGGGYNFKNGQETTTLMTLTSGGLLGIGTTSPRGLLSISNSASTPMDLPLLTIASTTAGTATTTLFTVQASGNVGIGTANPWSKLVISNDTADPFLTISGRNVGLASQGILFKYGASNYNAGYIGSITTNGGSSGSLVFSTVDQSTGEVMRIANSGNVGIGTTSPWGLLSVNANGLAAGAPQFVVGSSTRTDLIVTQSGNVGIGKTNPTYTLDVNGIINASQYLYVNSAAYIGGVQIDNLSRVISATANNDFLGLLSGQGGGEIDLIGPENAENSGSIIFRTGGLGAPQTNPIALFINNQGRVGIGTTTPVSLLQIAGATAPKLTISDTDADADQKHWFIESNTGSFNIGTTSDALATNAVYRALTISSSGYLGIGTTSPAKKLSTDGLMYIGGIGTSTIESNLEVLGQIKIGAGSFYLNGSGITSSDGSISIMAGASATTTLANINIIGNLWQNNSPLAASQWTTLGSNIYYNTGFIGIGTTTPKYALTINASNAITNLFQIATTTNQGIMTVNTNGYVGIGTTSPAYTLDVAGSTAFGTGDEAMRIDSNGYVGIGTNLPSSRLAILDSTSSLKDVFTIATSSSGIIFKVDSYGNTYGDGAYASPAADYAEYFLTESKNLQPGEAVCVDVLADNAVKRCERGADINLMGIVSTRPAVIGNYRREAETNPGRYVIVGMLGQVDALVSDENGRINPGDSLTSASSTPGYVMRANGGESTVGVALESFGEDRIGTSTKEVELGRIKVLISRRNKSLAVEEVENLVMERIASMKIEDEVQLMIKQAVDDLNLDPRIEKIAQTEADKLDAVLTARLDDVNGLITNYELRITNQIADLNYRLMDSELRLTNLERAVASSTVTVINPADITASSTGAAFIVNQTGAGDVADFRAGGVSVLTIAESGQVKVMGSLLVDGRIMLCSGGYCSDNLDNAVEETMADLGVEGKVVAGAFEGYCGDGLVWVPGSAKYGTLPGFCVEADLHKTSDVPGTSDVWVNLSQGEAQFACQSLGAGYHLLSENEWLTIAENILAAASGQTLDVPGTSNVLTNDNVINNLTGAVSEWTSANLPAAGLPTVPSRGQWLEYGQVIDFKGLNIAPDYYLTDADNRIGRIFVGSAAGLKGFVRGGSGIYSLDLSKAPNEASDSVGFRCGK